MDKHCNLPRSKTGLVPSTVRRRMDALSSSLSPLPAQPSPELYQFRGDFLNARNRKRAAAKAKKMEMERRAKVEAAAAAGEKECGSSMIVHPPTPRQLPTRTPIGWNTTYKQNEEYSLTPEERKKQIQNKSRFSEFLRIEAAKRHSRSSTKTGITNVPEKSTPQDTRRQKTKPPVPRLSALALGKKVMGKENIVNIVNPASANRRSIGTSKKPKEKVNAASARNKERRKDYLTFISKEPKQMPERETAINVGAPKDKQSNVESNNVDSKPAIADDDSIFRLQMERIVQRAADLVIEKQQKTDVTTNDDVPTTSQSLDFDKVVKVKQQDDNTQQLPSKDTLRVGDSESSCPNDATNLLSSNTSPQSDAKEDLSLSVSVDTEVIPRVPVPMQTIANARRDLSRSRLTHLYDHNHIQNEFSSDDDSSSGSGLFDSETDTYTASTTTLYHRAVNEVAMAELLDVCQDTTSVIQQTVDEPTRKEHPPRQPRDCGEFFEVSASIEDDFFSLFE